MAYYFEARNCFYLNGVDFSPWANGADGDDKVTVIVPPGGTAHSHSHYGTNQSGHLFQLRIYGLYVASQGISNPTHFTTVIATPDRGDDEDC